MMKGSNKQAAETGANASGAAVRPIVPGAPTILRPVIFVVDATSKHPPFSCRSSHGRGGHRDVDYEGDDEPFDVRKTSSLTELDAHGVGGGKDGGGEKDANLYRKILLALLGEKKSGGGDRCIMEEKISLAGSYTCGIPTPFSPASDLSAFSRIPLRRWTKASSPRRAAAPESDSGGMADDCSAKVLAGNMEYDPHDHGNTSLYHDYNFSAAGALVSSYSKENPPVNFLSKRARIVPVSARHAFPPSKFPRGKIDPSLSIVAGGIGTTMMLGEQQQSGSSSSPWMSSYDIQNEGILPSGWLEKHARALPSAVLVITTLQLPSNDDDEDEGDDDHDEVRQKNHQERRLSIKHATRVVENLRETLAEKRGVALHLVCLLEENKVVGKDARWGKNSLNAIKEMICQECYLPRCQVVLLESTKDLEPEEFESGILRSPYLDGASSLPPSSNLASSAALSSPTVVTAMMNPLLRQLDRSLRDSSASYYSSLAEAQERKLMLWRNRYHSANVSFEVNTLLAAMRCARYAIKVGTFREFQIRTGGGDFGGQWTDKKSSAMKHYDEAYRWVVELHRRAISWRATALASSYYSSGKSLAPITPGEKFSSLDDMNSPKVTESPGGGIGVELSLLPAPGGAYVSPPSSAAPPPPPSSTPMIRRSSPALTSKEGYSTAESIAFFASLWEQCRSVAHIINAKLLRSTTTSSAGDDAGNFCAEVEEQWCRHRFIFLSKPQGVPNFQASQNDDFFGPVWHRSMYVVEEVLTYARIAEERWRRALASQAAAVAAAADETVGVATLPATILSLPRYHLPGAPWKVYSELSKAVLGLRRAILQKSGGGRYLNEWLPPSSAISGRKFVGSIVYGESGFGTMSWQFENESKREHQAIALGYVLHALDLLDGHLSLCHDTSTESDLSSSASESPTQQPMSSASLHYFSARLLMTLDDPTGASVHLKIASAQTKSWPSLHLSIQRALSTCTERYAEKTTGLNPSSISVVPNTAVPNTTDLQNSCIELLLLPDSCKLLSPEEMMKTQMRVWPTVPFNTKSMREVVWTHNDTYITKPPFEFAVSFLNSTHAASNDAVTACVSIKSCLSFGVVIESMQLLTTSGTHEVPNLKHREADRSLVLSWKCKKSMGKASYTTNNESDQGIQVKPNEMALFLTELLIPSNLSHASVDGTSTENFKLIPKNGRLCNMGFSRAAGNICESRLENCLQQKTSIYGKPVEIASISEAPSFHGGVPLVCHGLVLTLKQAGCYSSLKLRIESPNLISPLQRSGTQRSLMEESNYTSHSWLRPAHHPWCLGPRVLRVLSPRSRMTVSNLTGPLTEFKAVKGTVNRILLQLKAGSDVSCWDVRVRLKCTTMKTLESANGSTFNVGPILVEPHLTPTFVRKATDSAVNIVTEKGVVLPAGWEPRKDVGTDESQYSTTSVSPHIGARKSLLFPLDIFHPLDQSLSFGRDAYTCSTSYEVIFTYRQVQFGKGTDRRDDPGDNVMVMISGSIEWIPPFAAEFYPCNGPMKPFPCGIQHSSNMRWQSSPEPTSAMSTELIAADGDSIRMRCFLEAYGIGSNVAATILRVTTKEKNKRQEELYSSDSPLSGNKLRQGSKLSLSYSVLAQRDNENGGGHDTIPLGIICVDWKPASLYLNGNLMATVTADEFGSAHGPLGLPGLAPVIFHGPQCHVLPSLFKANVLNFPATPKVGTPFCMSYQVTNQTADSQTLVLHLNYEQVSGISFLSCPQLLGGGKLKNEMKIGPFETKSFSFTFMSMVTGKVCMPPLTVYSGRQQTWVINETLSPRYLFVIP